GSVYLLRATVREIDQDAAGALADLERALELAPNEVTVLQFGATLRERLGAPGGIALLDRAAELAPTNPAIYLDRGELLAAEGAHERALSNFHRVLTLDAACKAAHVAR